MKNKSIITDNWDECFVCSAPHNLQEHHVMFGTANRKNSEKYGLTIPLCINCHTGSQGAHNNRELDRCLKVQAQIEFEAKYSYDAWMRIFQKNYR